MRHWREKLETSAQVVEHSADGWPALIRSGGLHYLAGWADEVALDRILGTLCAEAGIVTDPMPDGVRRRDSATHWFLFNYNSVAVEWQGRSIPPAGVDWQPL